MLKMLVFDGKQFVQADLLYRTNRMIQSNVDTCAQDSDCDNNYFLFFTAFSESY